MLFTCGQRLWRGPPREGVSAVTRRASGRRRWAWAGLWGRRVRFAFPWLQYQNANRAFFLLLLMALVELPHILAYRANLKIMTMSQQVCKFELANNSGDICRIAALYQGIPRMPGSLSFRYCCTSIILHNDNIGIISFLDLHCLILICFDVSERSSFSILVLSPEAVFTAAIVPRGSYGHGGYSRSRPCSKFHNVCGIVL